MFTVEQIKELHAKVKSGADFPQFIQDLIGLGVIYYETFVTDGHTDYWGDNNFKVSSSTKYPEMTVDNVANVEKFEVQLKRHQAGATNYLTFCEACARFGVQKWEVCMQKMTCTYRDKAGNEVLVEDIPVPA